MGLPTTCGRKLTSSAIGPPPARLFAVEIVRGGGRSVVENVLQQRFMAVGFLAAAVMLAVIVDHLHPALGGPRGVVAALAAATVALVPIAVTFTPRLPYTMRPVILPRWYREVAPTLPPGRVLLSYPAPFSGIQSSMSWQAVNGINYSQAGGGGPQGVAHRAGTAQAGFTVLSSLAFGLRAQPPTGTRTQLAAVRHALVVWRVNTVVIATNPTAPSLQQGHDPAYAAAFMTAALGRLPTVQAGAWVWEHVDRDLPAPLHMGPRTLASCVAGAARRSHRAGASMQAAICVGLDGLGNG